MKVLHYSLGLAPYRSGGMTTWSMDLMKKQIEEGNEVTLLFPAEIKLVSHKISVKISQPFEGIRVYRLMNPLPVPLLYGIDSTTHYFNYDKTADFTEFFNATAIDVIHLHTLMGLPIEFLEQAKQRDIDIIYTAHDTFGIWPEASLGKNELNMDPIFDLGYVGNQKVLSYATIVLAQSAAYRRFKSARPIKWAKAVLRTLNSKTKQGNSSVPSEIAAKVVEKGIYVELRSFYKNYFDLIDIIHFSSLLTEEIFAAYGVHNESFITPVYHSKMITKPNLTLSLGSNTVRPIRLLYNGTLEQYKGYNLLLSVLDELAQESTREFILVVYGTDTPARSYVEAHTSYTIAEVEKVYTDVDVTAVPSLCYETFGMVVAESLGFGVPVIVSRMVGSKNLLEGGKYGSEFQSRTDFKEMLRSIIEDSTTLDLQKKAIVNSQDLQFDSNKTYTDIMQHYQAEVSV